MDGEDVIQWLSRLVRDGGVGVRPSNGDEHKGTFVFGRPETVGQEPHGAGGVGECGEASLLGGGQQQSRGDAHRFVHVVDLLGESLIPVVPHPFQNHDQPRGFFQKWLLFVGANVGEIPKPVFAGPAVVERPLFHLSGSANFRFQGRVLNRHESPRLFVCSAGGGPGRGDDGSNQ